MIVKKKQNLTLKYKVKVKHFEDFILLCNYDRSDIDDFVKIFTEHFKKIDIWEIIGKKETLEIGF